MYFTLLCLAAIVLALVLHYRQVYTYFSRHGVKHFTPIPLLGNLTTIILKMERIGQAIERDYKSFPEERFVGRYACTTRQLVIRDLELIKKITVKDFGHFCDRLINIETETDPLLGRSIFYMKGQEWKAMRSTLSPAFTGSKIRLMVPFMVEVGERMIKALRERSLESQLVYIDVDVSEITARFAKDLIVSFAYGLKVDSCTDVDNICESGLSIRLRQLLVSLGVVVVPKLIKFLKLSMFPNSLDHVYRHLVKSAMWERDERNIIRPDMIQIFMEAKKRKLTHEKTTKDVDAGYSSTVEESNADKKVMKREWSDDELIAQAITFVMANSESTNTAMSFLLHELALNPDVQEKLYQEIMENETKNGGKFDYTSIQQMTYMDMVVSESLRLWPTVSILDRICIKDYNCGQPNDKVKEDFIVRKGDGVVISIMGIHRDPQYFPDPLKFDPDRFSDENKNKIHSLSYMPFGVGPRSCIGSRFALCEMKVMAYQLLKEMKLSPAAKTSIPVKLSSDTVFLKPKSNWVRMTPRN